MKFLVVVTPSSIYQLPLFCTFPNVSLSIKKVVTETLISKASLNSFYSRLGFKVIKDFVTSPNYEKACKQFHYESGNTKDSRKKIGLQCYLTIPRRVTFIYENRTDSNENKYVLKDLNYFPPLDDWFSYEYIDAEAKKKVDKTKGQLAENEIEKETKHYVEYLNHDPNWLKTITIEIDEFRINHEYIYFFMHTYMK